MDDMIFDDGLLPTHEEPIVPNDNLLGTSHHDPFGSPFDEEHPFPTYEQLRGIGFSSKVAHSITESLDHSYTQKELYHVLYESDNPVTAYNDMMDDKAYAVIDKVDDNMDEIEKSGLLGDSKANIHSTDVTSHYNEPSSVEDSDDEKELGSADCRSECKYNTGKTYEYADYGYSH